MNSNNRQCLPQTLPIEFETNWQNEYNRYNINKTSDSLNYSESPDTLELSPEYDFYLNNEGDKSQQEKLTYSESNDADIHQYIDSDAKSMEPQSMDPQLINPQCDSSAITPRKNEDNKFLFDIFQTLNKPLDPTAANYIPTVPPMPAMPSIPSYPDQALHAHAVNQNVNMSSPKGAQITICDQFQQHAFHPYQPQQPPRLINYCAYQIPAALHNPPRLQKFHPSQYNMKELLSMKLGIEGIMKYHLIQQFVQTLDGAKYIEQQLTANKNDGIISNFVKYLIEQNIDLNKISQTMYGNYVISELFNCCKDNDKMMLLNYFVYSSLSEMCLSQFGCRVIQNILKNIAHDMKMVRKIIKCFEQQTNGNLDKYLCSQNANHVIQSFISLVPPYDALKFVGDELQCHLVTYCNDIFACRVVQIFIKHYHSNLNVLAIFDEQKSYLNLSNAKYGNYVIQCIAKTNEPYSDLLIFKKFRNKFNSQVFGNIDNLMNLSKNKFGSNVLETCIESATKSQIELIVKSVCSKNGIILFKLLNDPFGNYVARRLLNHCVNNEYHELNNEIISIVSRYIVHEQTTFGKEFINKCMSIEQNYNMWYYN